MMNKVVGLGDLLVSLSPMGYNRFVQTDTFHAFYTGAEANVVVSLSQLGMKTAYLTRVPEHEIGQSAVNALQRYGVDCSDIARGGDRIGVLYLEKGAAQRPSKVIYDRLGSGICEAEPEMFDFDHAFRDADWLHFTGITPALSDRTAKLCEVACKKAKEKGMKISCDLNYRKKLWSTEKANRVMTGLLSYVDVLIANEEDADKVLGIRAQNTDVNAGKINAVGYIDVAKQIEARFGIHCVATTLRESISASDNRWSAMLYRNGEAFFSKKYDIHIVNRVGGGDSFSAGLIYALCHDFDSQKAIEFATAASCLKHSIEDDFNLVSYGEVVALMEGDGSGRVRR